MSLIAVLVGFLFAKHEDVALANLVKRAAATRSTALVVYIDGKKVVDENFGHTVQPIHCMSATKSLVSIAVGMLIDEGKIKSLDTTVHDYFPQYKGGGKELITLRHLMTHTSGIQTNDDTRDIYESQDFVKNALDARLVSKPGQYFDYNNRGTNLLAGILSKAAGEPLDEYLKRKLFTPLGITNFKWGHDPAGNPQGMAGCLILPDDLAKIGLLLDAGGVWEGNQIISKKWIEESTKPNSFSKDVGPPYGYLWWMVGTGHSYAMTSFGLTGWWSHGGDGFTKDLRNRLMKICDHPYTTKAELMAAIRKYLNNDREYQVVSNAADVVDDDPTGKTNGPPFVGFAAEGYLGNYLIVLPKSHIVVVRMKVAGQDNDGWDSILSDVAALIKK